MTPPRTSTTRPPPSYTVFPWPVTLSHDRVSWSMRTYATPSSKASMAKSLQPGQSMVVDATSRLAARSCTVTVMVIPRRVA